MSTLKSGVIQKFADSINADAVAGIHQDAVNRYLAKHFTVFPTLYAGSGKSDELDLKYDYSVEKPVTMDFTALENGKASLKRAILADPLFHSSKPVFRARFTDPTITAHLPRTTIKFFAVSTGEHLADVTVTADVKCAIIVNPGTPGTYSLFVISVTITISSLKMITSTTHPKTGCDLNKLIEHILNHVLAAQLNRFLQTLPLPQPNVVISGVSTSLKQVAVEDSTLLVGLSVKAASLRAPHLSTFTLTRAGETMELAMFGKLIPRKTTKVKKDGEFEQQLMLSDMKREHPAFPKLPFSSFSSKSVPDGDIFISFSSAFLQVLADVYLNIKVDEEHGDEGSVWYYRYGFGYHVFSPVAKVIASGIEFAAQLTGYADGQAGLKGCSSWVKVDLGADAQAVPRVLADALLVSNASGKELWVWPTAFPFVIVARAHMSPYIPGLDFILSLIVSALLSLFSAVLLPLISAFLQIKLVTLPDTVPGTPVPMNPKIKNIGNWNGMLFFSFNMGI